MGNGVGVDYRYLIDKMIDAGEKNLDLQADTLTALHELREQITDESRTNEEIRVKLDTITKSTGEIRQCQMVDCIVILKSMDKKIDEFKKIYNQVRTLLAILSALVTIVGIIAGAFKIAG